MITALNLKYRPQRISQLDHQSAREALLKIFASGKIPQSFLFSGPKGIGKTSAARIVAKAVNCEKVVKEGKVSKVSKEFEPCGECATCVSITNGTNLDVLEIDAASNRGIDDIRELRDKIRLASSGARFKVYIIDEVHMLTNEAFNALLKTLEEPPEHALFILCTTAPEKIPETIISRCTRINFKKAKLEEMIMKLKLISKAEEFKFSEEDFQKIAKAAGGSFRDAIKILEQAASSSVAEVVETLGEFNPENLLSLLVKKDIRGAILWINKAVEQGANLRLLTEEVLRILRDLLLSKYGLEIEEKNDLEINKLTTEQLKQLVELFSKAAMSLKNSLIPQLPLELAVIEWDEGGKLDGRSGKLDVEVGRGKEEREEKSNIQKLSPQSEAKSQVNQASHFSSLTSSNLEEILAKWPEVLEKVKPLNHSVQAFLKATRPLELGEGFLTLEVFYKFHKDQLESDKCRRIVEDVCGQVYCSPVKIKFILGEKPHPPSSRPPAGGTDFGGAGENQGKEEIEKSLSSEDDLVKIAEEIFNGGIIH